MIYRALLACALSTAVLAAADTLSYADSGIAFTLPGTGLVVMSWPEFTLPGNTTVKAATTKVEERKAHLTYPDGTTITTDLHGGTLTLTLSGAPANAESKGVRVSFTLPMSLQGATWTMGDKTGTFPTEKPEKPFLFQGNKDSFAISQAGKERIAIAVPQWSYQQLQDNREWKTNTFFWMAIMPINKDNLTMTVTVKPGAK